LKRLKFTQSRIYRKKSVYNVFTKRGIFSTYFYDRTLDIVSNETWLREIDWYLLPLPQQEPERTAKDLVNDFKKFLKEQHPSLNIDWVFEEFVKTGYFKYTSQFTPQISVSDEEIEKRIRQILFSHKTERSYSLSSAVADLMEVFAMSSQITSRESKDLRSELIKMLKSEKFQLAYGVVPDEYAVDEYLKSNSK
jgi:hypothetical protein